MSLGIRVQLWIMMFLQFFVWGAWAVTMGTYLGVIGFTDPQIGQAYTTTAWGAIVAPFVIGIVADRFFQAQNVLGVLHLVGAVMMYWASTVTAPVFFFWVLLGYALCYMPTLGLVNTVAFNNMTNPEKQFPVIRVLGTLGWIVAGWSISIPEWFGGDSIEGTAVPLRMAAIASLVLGVYCFTLPKTPPQARGEAISVSKILGLDTLQLMKQFSFSVFVISSLLICIPLAFYYNFTNPFLNEIGVEKAVFWQSFGQISEVVFMLVMPLMFAFLGVKYMLLVGMLAWVARYLCFAHGDAAGPGFWLLFLGILLHGVCYDFFFVTGQIYVDKKAPAALRASAQGFIAMITYGFGLLIGGYASGYVVGLYAEGEGHAWRSIWYVPALMAMVVAVLFFLLFRDRVKQEPDLAESAPTEPPERAGQTA